MQVVDLAFDKACLAGVGLRRPRERSGVEIWARSAPSNEPPVSGQRRVAPRASFAKRLALKSAALSSKATIARFVGGAAFIVVIRVYNSKPRVRGRRCPPRECGTIKPSTRLGPSVHRIRALTFGAT